MFKKLFQWLKTRFGGVAPVSPPETVAPESEVPDLLSGSWKLSTLLDALPKYHSILKKCDRWRSSELGALLRMGPTIIGSEDAWCVTSEETYKWEVLPAQFFVSWGSPDHKNIPKFFGGTKVDPPLTVQRMPGECYKFLVYLDEISTWVAGYFWVDGHTVHLAKERKRTYNEIRTNGKKYPVRVPAITYCNELEELWRESADDKLTAEEIVRLCFASALNWWSERSKRWTVITKNKYRRVSFSVEEGRHLYFFRDRDKIALTPTGKRKTIFHIVCAHERTLNTGKVIQIKQHSRGVREFFWHDLECHIFSPGWHGHDFFATFDGVAYIDPDEDEGLGNLIDATGVAEKAARVIEGTAVH